MAIPGQASGGFTESSSALRIFYVGHRNSLAAELTTDGFTQQNPPIETKSGTVTDQLGAAPVRGVLSSSVAFTRPDVASQRVGGPKPDETAPSNGFVRPVGLFINDADGNEFENTPAQASDQAPYVSGQGTMGARLFETQVLGDSGGSADSGSPGDDLVYATGQFLYASRNGYLTSARSSSGVEYNDLLEVEHGDATDHTEAADVGIVTIVPDATHDELVFDQRI